MMKKGKRLGWVLVALILQGCGLRAGLINLPPPPTSQQAPSRVTVVRPASFTGWPLPMIFTINGEEIYGLWIGQAYSFLLDPGDYSFGYYLGFNECRKYVRIERKPSHYFYLSPPCRIGPAD